MDSRVTRVINLANQVLAAQPRVRTPVHRQEQRRLLGSLAYFAQAFWHIIEPNTPLIWTWSLAAVCQHLQALLEGKLAKRNLLIVIPPGMLKSTLTSVLLPAWWWARHPSWRATFASGTPAVAVRDSLRCRAILDSVKYRDALNITWTFAEDQNQKLLYQNSASGFRQATTTGSRITGSRPHCIFVDDALDAAEAHSKASRDAVNQWWDLAYANRLSDLKSGTRCVIQQRLHPEDLAGHILATEPNNWEVLCIPQLWEESRRTVTSLGWTDPRSEDNQLLFPERFPQDVVDMERVRLGASGFAGQHQQRPTAAEGELFKRGCLRLLDTLPPFTQIVLAMDTAYSTKTTADYSAIVVAGQCAQGMVLLDVIKTRVAYPQLRSLAEQLAQRWHPSALLVENASSGRSLIQSLQQETNLPVVAVDVVGDKISRAATCLPAWEAGRIFALTGAPWLDEFLLEIHDFPKSVNDDVTDATVMAIRYLLQSPGSGMLAYYADLLKQDQAAATTPNTWAASTPTMQQRLRDAGVVSTDIASPWHKP